MAFASTVEPLRAANLIKGKSLYRWSQYSPDGGPIASSSGLEVLTTALPAPQSADFEVLVLCSGLGAETYKNPKLRRFLRRIARRDLMIGSVSTASFLLADAGLLDGRRCTIHWDYIEAFREAYPELDIRNELFIVDNRVFTCAGGIAAMDFMLEFIRHREGYEFANCVAENFIYGTMRQAEDSQRMALRIRLGVAHRAILQAAELMEDAIETPLRQADIASRVGISTRQLERLFYRHIGCSPMQHYIRLRLDRARKLLRRSTLPVLDIGVACGFASASHFARAYKRQFGLVPSSDRGPELVIRL